MLVEVLDRRERGCGWQQRRSLSVRYRFAQQVHRAGVGYRPRVDGLFFLSPPHPTPRRRSRSESAARSLPLAALAGVVSVPPRKVERISVRLLAACLALIAMLLAADPTKAAGIEIPLELVNIASGGSSVPTYKLGIWVGLGGGMQQLYEFDTGGEGFWAGYSNNLDPGVSQWWGPSTPTGQTGTISYSSKTQYTANIVTTSIQIYGDGTSRTPLFDSGSQTVAVAQIQTATQEFTDIYQPIQQGQPFLQTAFYGDFGASLMPILAGTAPLYGVLPQLPVSQGLDAGFIVNTGGYGNQSPTLTLGISPQDNARFATQVAMTPAPGYQYPTTNLPAYAEQVITASMTLANAASGTSVSLVAPLILDTGAVTGSIRPGPTVDSAVIAPYLTGKYVIPGTTIQFTAPGATGYLGLDATFIAGTTTGLDAFGTDTNSQNPNSVNLGLLGFNAYETMFNLSTGNVGFTAIVPEPSAGLLLGIGACVSGLCGKWWRRNGRRAGSRIWQTSRNSADARPGGWRAGAAGRRESSKKKPAGATTASLSGSLLALP